MMIKVHGTLQLPHKKNMYHSKYLRYHILKKLYFIKDVKTNIICLQNGKLKHSEGLLFIHKLKDTKTDRGGKRIVFPRLNLIHSTPSSFFPPSSFLSLLLTINACVWVCFPYYLT